MSSSLPTAHVDVLVIGAGMAGASVAWHLHGQATVVVLEQETQPGYHTTGRSAAFFSETYGGPAILPLTAASKAFLFSPPTGFTAVPLVTPRGVLHLARQGQDSHLQQMLDDFGAAVPALRLLTPQEIRQRAPMLKPDACHAALYDPGCMDMDVAALHAGFLRSTTVHTDSRVTHIERHKTGWQVTTTSAIYHTRILVNAAGAWGDHIASLAGVLPVGLEPRRRTIITFAPTGSMVDPAAPLIIGPQETYYFKPDGTDIWASPADETLSAACDAQPEEIDVAKTVDLIETATTFHITALKRKWAGLRTFVADRTPVYGEEPSAPGFFWCVGQGGWGIQTAPAAGRLCAALILNEPVPDDLQAAGITESRYARRSAVPV